MADDQILAIYDVALHDEYLADEGRRYGAVPRMRSLRKVAAAIARDERRTTIAMARSLIRGLDTEPDGMIRAADALDLLEQLAKESS